MTEAYTVYTADASGFMDFFHENFHMARRVQFNVNPPDDARAWIEREKRFKRASNTNLGLSAFILYAFASEAEREDALQFAENLHLKRIDWKLIDLLIHSPPTIRREVAKTMRLVGAAEVLRRLEEAQKDGKDPAAQVATLVVAAAAGSPPKPVRRRKVGGGGRGE